MEFRRLRTIKVLLLLVTTSISHSQVILEALEGGVPNKCFSSSVTISKTPCSAVAGATINDDPATTMGVEYNWSGATGFVDNGTTRALVQINGQCWYRRNAINLPTNYSSPVASSNVSPVFAAGGGLDQGWSGFYVNNYIADNGRLYQWKAAMNYILPLSTGTWTINDYLVLERSRGICASGWHIPSDCEWQYLEDYLKVPSQYLDKNMAWTIRTYVNAGATSPGSGSYLSALLPTAPANNETGFSALITGYLDASNDWGNNNRTHFWSSTLGTYNTVHNLSTFYERGLFRFYGGIERYESPPSYAYSVRCLKD